LILDTWDVHDKLQEFSGENRLYRGHQMINFFHRLFLAKIEDDLRLEGLRTINDQLRETNDRLEETNDRLEETSSKLKESVDRMIEKISNKNLKLQIKYIKPRTPD
jgi:hypothetical protein